MGRTRLNVSLAQLILGFAFCVPAFGDADGEPSAAKLLGLRFDDSPTRRSADTNLVPFGRSGGSDNVVASKKDVKREIVDASASATPSLTCVPATDTDTSGRVLCYSPFNVSRRFLLVTERGSRGRNHRQLERTRENEDEQEGGNDDDLPAEADVGYDDDNGGGDEEVRDGDDDDDDDDRHETGDEGSVYESENDAQNRTAPHSRTHDSNNQRFGRSTAASQADGKDLFARFGRRRDNFMRLGRVGSKKNESPLHEGGSQNLETNYGAALLAGDKRRSANFIRFGRERSPLEYEPPSSNRRDGSRQAAAAAAAAAAVTASANGDDDDGDGDQRTTRRSLEGQQRHRDAFVRLGRHGPGDMNQLRFGRSSDRIGARLARRPGNFMRLGRSGGGGGGHFDLDMFRETRRRDSFLRLGRAAGGSTLRHSFILSS